MITVSLCMIVKNEERTLSRCLDTVADLVEEIVIVDTGSTDGTLEVARQYTDRIWSVPWTDDFAAARNAAFDRATMEYCLWLDADDVLEPEDRARFRALKEGLSPDTDVVMLPYRAGGGEDGLVYYRERLIRRGAGLRWEGAVHEVITPVGRVEYGDAAVTHRRTGTGDPDRNLRIYQGLLSRGHVLTPREQYYYARELLGHGLDKAAAEQLEAFLERPEGWWVDRRQACLELGGCYERLGRTEDAFRALTRGLRFGPPGAELCCALGWFFLAREELPGAVYWYERALECPRRDSEGSFVHPDCYGYIPWLQLCVCWYRLGDRARAEACNEAAGALKPQGSAYLRNRAFFKTV